MVSAEALMTRQDAVFGYGILGQLVQYIGE
jgi:hypothetical protein